MQKIKDWFIRHKDDLLIAWGTLGTMVSLLLIVFTIALVAMTEDLVGVVETKNQELSKKEGIIDTLTYERNYYYYLVDELNQTYEDVVPKGQYIQDIEYLESVILELRTQCELELDKKCECY